MPRVSLIILTWNGKRFLPDCLDSLAAQTYGDFETILVDNGSTDGSAAYVRDHYPWVRLLVLPENTGFAEGNLRGLAECSGEYIVTLNNDTRAEPGFLAALVAAADGEPTIGMVAAKMLNFYRPDRIDSVGIGVTLAGMAYNIGVGEKDTGMYDTPVEVFGPCAGAALYKRVMLDQIGFFDPAFFAYYEDADLAWRGRLAGWRCVTAPQAVVYHVHSATGGRMSPFTVYHVQRNKWYVFFKNWPLAILMERLPHVLIHDGAAFLLALLRGRGLSALRARLAVLRQLPALLRRRREVQRLRTLPANAVEKLFSEGGGVLQTFHRKFRER